MDLNSYSYLKNYKEDLSLKNKGYNTSNLSINNFKLDNKALEILNEFNPYKFQENSEEEITEKVSQYRLKIIASISYKNSIFQNNPIKKLVSKKKVRFEFEGYDLDLTYITDRIIAMGFPADNIEKVYRNPLEEVVSFFEKRHKNRYKVYNLCSERIYPSNTFYSQGYYPFDDHEAPPLDLLLPFCDDMHNWLKAHRQNIVAVHCKAGKGRTGLMICCYLIYSNFLNTAEQALKYYGLMRTTNGKGVTIQSQIRYLEFFEEIIKRKIPNPLDSPKLQLKQIKLNTVPNFNLFSEGCTPFFEIKNDKFFYSLKQDKDGLKDYALGEKIEFSLTNIYLKGDFHIVFYNDGLIGSAKMFKFWFNTYFVPLNGKIVFKKKNLDMKIKNDIFLNLSEDFKIELIFNIGDNILENNDNDVVDQDNIDYFKDVNINNDFKMYL